MKSLLLFVSLLLSSGYALAETITIPEAVRAFVSKVQRDEAEASASSSSIYVKTTKKKTEPAGYVLDENWFPYKRTESWPSGEEVIETIWIHRSGKYYLTNENKVPHERMQQEHKNLSGLPYSPGDINNAIERSGWSPEKIRMTSLMNGEVIERIYNMQAYYEIPSTGHYSQFELIELRVGRDNSYERINRTEIRRQEIRRDIIKEVNPQYIRITKGKTSRAPRIVYMLFNPSEGYGRRFMERDAKILSTSDVEYRVVFAPFDNNVDENRSNEELWASAYCAEDPTNKLLSLDFSDSSRRKECTADTKAGTALLQELGLSGLPAFIDMDGHVVNGYLTAEVLEDRLLRQ